MEDSRFKEVRKFKKKELPPNLHWYAGQEYLYEELLGIYGSEVSTFSFVAEEAYKIFEQATDKIISERSLALIGIPDFFHHTIEQSWRNRHEQPFLYGRFDISGGFDHLVAKVIEFNADTCSTLPETVLWQKIQLAELSGMKGQHNSVEADLVETFKKLRRNISHDDAYVLASSFGHKEDELNCNVVLDTAYEAGFQTFYCDLEQVTFSEDDGIFFEIGGEYQPVDVWFKMVPWDWMFNEEPELAKTLSKIITAKKAVVLNPPYTAVWQNKKFLAYITHYFPNQYIAETYTSADKLQNPVVKPVYGRMGENITIPGEETSKGDFARQPRIYQQYYPLASDRESYYYQPGVFYTNRASAINFRTQQAKIITDDCEFMSHFII